MFSKLQIMKKYLFVFAMAFVMISCGHRQKDKDIDMELVELETAVNESSNTAISNIDSLAMMADELSPAEATKVLVTYMRIHEKASAAGDTRRDLETLRKYVDFYDIVMSANGDEMRLAFEKLAARRQNVDIIASAKQYRELLADYASGSAIEESAPEETSKPETADSTTTQQSEPEATSQPVEE